MMPSQPLPVLRLGSRGDSVALLQKALNLAPSNQSQLTPDSQFGSKTRGRVVEFQGQHALIPDGVVGPNTWNMLQPFLRQILQIIDHNTKPSTDEDTLRQRIVDVAQASFDSWGWGESGTVTPDGSPRIAAARGFGPTMANSRPRQGGAALATIFSMAAAGTPNVLTITSEMEAIYQQDPNQHPDRRENINKKDIGSWCGIFTAYCYRSSGLMINWNLVKTQDKQFFQILGPNAAVRKGDIGVYDPKLNHHFLVIADSDPGQHVYSIDGNLSNPSEKVVSPWNSVISKRFYLRTTLSSRAGRFLRPIFSAMQSR